MAEGEKLHDRYDDSVVAVGEMIFGEGFLSPGGPEAVREIVRGLDLAGKTVLDVGCGIGGVDHLLAREFGCRVIGFDVEPMLIDIGRARLAEAGLSGRIDLRLVEPGLLPLGPAAVDIVFGKDSWLLIEDKPRFFAEAFRVLRPGGALAASEWTGDGKPYSQDMLDYFALRGMTYHLETADAYRRMMLASGLVEVEIADTSADTRARPRECCQLMEGPLSKPMIAAIGRERHAHFVAMWQALTKVFEKGELGAARLRARKPA